MPLFQGRIVVQLQAGQACDHVGFRPGGRLPGLTARCHQFAARHGFELVTAINNWFRKLALNLEPIVFSDESSLTHVDHRRWSGRLRSQWGLHNVSAGQQLSSSLVDELLRSTWGKTHRGEVDDLPRLVLRPPQGGRTIYSEQLLMSHD